MAEVISREIKIESEAGTLFCMESAILKLHKGLGNDPLMLILTGLYGGNFLLKLGAIRTIVIDDREFY